MLDVVEVLCEIHNFSFSNMCKFICWGWDCPIVLFFRCFKCRAFGGWRRRWWLRTLRFLVKIATMWCPPITILRASPFNTTVSGHRPSSTPCRLPISRHRMTPWRPCWGRRIEQGVVIENLGKTPVDPQWSTGESRLPYNKLPFWGAIVSTSAQSHRV